MPEFSQASLDKLSTCHPLLQQLCNYVIKQYDFAVVVGHRNKEDQDSAIAAKKSQTPWPTSKHNSTPSMAVDIAPVPIDWEDIDKFRELSGYMKAAADTLGIKIRWGGDFITLKDYDHFELTE